MRAYYKTLPLYFILLFFKFNFIYAQSPKDYLSIFFKIIKAGEWLSKITVNNEKVKVYYIQVEVTAPNFDQAKDSAFKLAIQEALGTFLVTEKVVKFDEIIRDEIVMYSGGYIQDFKIIKENKNSLSTTLLVDVWVSESKIANRLLNTSVNKGELDGGKLSAQLSTIVKDKDDAFKLLQIILNDFPSRAFEIDVDRTNFRISGKKNSTVEIPIEIRWSQKYLESLKEALLLLRDGDELRSGSNVSYWLMGSQQKNNDAVTISISSNLFDFISLGVVDASFNDDEIIDLFYSHFNSAPMIMISLNYDFEKEKITNCFYLQRRGHLFTKSKYDKQNIHEIVTLSEFFEFNTKRAHFEINEKYLLKNIFPIELYAKNLNKISNLTKASVSIVKNFECKTSK